MSELINHNMVIQQIQESRESLAALAMRERAASEIDCGGCDGDCPMPHVCCATDAASIRALPTTFTDAELLAAAMQLSEVRALLHLADRVAAGTHMADPLHCMSNNALAPFMKGGDE